MADKVGLGQAFNFHKGLESVSVEKTGPRESGRTLPRQSYIVPSEAPVVEQLEELWNQQSLEQRLVENLRPEISDRSLLIPGRYQGLLRESEEALQAMANREDPAGKLQDALGVLGEERELTSLLNTYRSSLFQA